MPSIFRGTPTRRPDRSPAEVVARFLDPGDVDALMVLEHQKWTTEQAARPDEIIARIRANPTLSIGAFDPHTGQARASLFLKPIDDRLVRAAATWRECADAPPPQAPTRSLFGVSMSSIDPAAVSAIVVFLWPYTAKAGWRWLYLGSPLPGLRAWRRAHPAAPVEDYVYSRRHGLPLDPQLRYYHGLGLNRIEACKPDYFPHERSLDHGALISGPMPLSAAVALWRLTPLATLKAMRPVLRAVL